MPSVAFLEIVLHVFDGALHCKVSRNIHLNGIYRPSEYILVERSCSNTVWAEPDR